MKKQDWFVYIVTDVRGHFYTGITTDVDRRFKEHADSARGAKYFRGGPPVEVVFTKKFPNRSEASKFEARVKKLSRAQKLSLVEAA